MDAVPEKPQVSVKDGGKKKRRDGPLTQNTTDAKVRLSLDKFLNLLEKHNIIPNVIYSVEGFVRAMEVNGLRPFVILVSDRYLIPIPVDKSVPMMEKFKSKETGELAFNAITRGSSIFGLATLTYPLFTIEVSDRKNIYTLNVDDDKAGTEVVKSTKSKKFKGENYRIASLEKDAEKILGSNDNEITAEDIEKSIIETPINPGNEIEFVFTDENGDVMDDDEETITSSLATGLPENPKRGIPPPDEDSLEMVYPAITIENIFELLNKTPKKFSRELTEAYARRDAEFDRQRGKKMETILVRFEELKKDLVTMDEKIKEKTAEEKRLSDLLDRVSETAVKGNDRAKLEREKLKLQSIAYRREAEVERTRLETRINNIIEAVLSTFDHIKETYE